MYFENIKDNTNELIAMYYVIIKDIEILISEYNLKTKKKRLLIQQRDAFQLQFDMLSQIQYFISPVKQDPNFLVKNSNGINVKIQFFDIACKDWLNRVHLRYLYPIILRLSEFSERRAKLRDIFIFVLSIFVSALIGAGITHWFDVKNDRDIDNLGFAILKKSDYVLDQLNQQKVIIDSLFKLQFVNTHK